MKESVKFKRHLIYNIISCLISSLIIIVRVILLHQSCLFFEGSLDIILVGAVNKILLLTILLVDLYTSRFLVHVYYV
jgi:membrane protein DedA with SNARE-associated domain